MCYGILITSMYVLSVLIGTWHHYCDLASYRTFARLEWMALGKSIWFTRGALPLLAALVTAPVFALPATAKVSGPASVARDAFRTAAAPGSTTEWWLGALNAQQAWHAAPEQ